MIEGGKRVRGKDMDDFERIEYLGKEWQGQSRKSKNTFLKVEQD